MKTLPVRRARSRRPLASLLVAAAVGALALLGTTTAAHALAANQLDTFTYQPPGTDNAIVIQVLKGQARWFGGEYMASNGALVFLQCAGGINVPLPVSFLRMTSANQDPTKITAISGSLTAMPHFEGLGSWPGALDGMTTTAPGGRLNFAAVTGADFNRRGLPLQLHPTRNFLDFQPLAGEALPSIGFGSAVLTAAKSNVDNQVNVLFDSTAPAIAIWGGMIGASFGGFDAAGIGLSATPDFEFIPAVTEDLPANTIPSFNGALFVGGTATVRGVTFTGTATVDVGPSLMNPGTPVRLGVNGSATVGLPILSDFTGLELTLANMTYFHQWNGPSDVGVFDGIAGGSALALSGLGFHFDLANYLPAPQWKASGRLAFNGGVPDLNGFYASLEARGGATVFGGVPLNDLRLAISGANGVLASAGLVTPILTFRLQGTFNKSGVTLVGTGSLAGSVSAHVDGLGTVSASLSADLTATVAANATSYAVGAGGKVRVCAQGVCTSQQASVTQSGGMPKVCVPNLYFVVQVPRVCIPAFCSPRVCVLGLCAPAECTPEECTPSHSLTVNLGNYCFAP